MNIAPTLLYSLGLPIPRAMEGKVQLAAFEDSFLRSRPIEWEETGRGRLPATPEPAGVTRDDQETEALVAQLKALGYLE